MRNNKHVVMIAFCVSIFGCESRVDQYLKKLDKKSFFYNNYEGWKVQEFPGKSYTISKIDHDTVKNLSFMVGDANIPIINEYDRKYPCFGTDTCFVWMISYDDTLFYYRQDKFGVKDFAVGEYAYRFTRLKLDPEELEYYLDHIDSLKRIRGNNLPILP